MAWGSGRSQASKTLTDVDYQAQLARHTRFQTKRSYSCASAAVLAGSGKRFEQVGAIAAIVLGLSIVAYFVLFLC